MKKLVPTTILLLAVLATWPGARACAQASAADTFLTVPIWVHVHTNLAGDDGSESPASTAAWLRANGYQGVMFAPHAVNVNIPEYRRIALEQNTDDFLVIPAREISVNVQVAEEGRVMCHMNAFGPADDPRKKDKQYSDDQLPELLQALRTEEAATVIFNHPWSCRRWGDSAALFDGIELFNDFGPDYESGEAFETAKSAYLKALKSGKNIFVVSGIDMHVMGQTVLGEFTTYVFPDEFDNEALAEAIRSGHTLAAFNSRLFKINMRPSLEPVALPGGAFEIKAAVGTKFYKGFKPELVVYRNGEEYTPPALEFEKRDKKKGAYSVYTLSFSDTLAPGDTACYVFEIPHYMFSSPYCFTGAQ